MGTLRIMDRTGDTKVEWSAKMEAPEDRTRYREEGVVSPAEAQAIFDKKVGMGFWAYAVAAPDKAGERKGKKLTAFDPQAETIVVAPPMAGG